MSYGESVQNEKMEQPQSGKDKLLQVHIFSICCTCIATFHFIIPMVLEVITSLLRHRLVNSDVMTSNTLVIV